MYKKQGVDVTLRPFDGGVGAARAVAAGSITAALSPTPTVVKMVSNANIPLTAIWGMENPDWLMGSMDPSKHGCKDLKGATIGVGEVAGARYIQMLSVLRSCHLTADDVKVLNLSSDVGAAMVAGQLTFGILHLDDLPVIERESGKPVTIMTRIKDVDVSQSYDLLVVRPSVIKGQREALVRMLAANMEAVCFMNNPANFKRVAEIARNSGINNSSNLLDGIKDIRRFVGIHYWPMTHDDGMSRGSIESVVRTQMKFGGIRAGKEPVPYDRLVDSSIWRDALKRIDGNC